VKVPPLKKPNLNRLAATLKLAETLAKERHHAACIQALEEIKSNLIVAEVVQHRHANRSCHEAEL
jgi:hypothetical protein